jgi:hypothetical protein
LRKSALTSFGKTTKIANLQLPTFAFCSLPDRRKNDARRPGSEDCAMKRRRVKHQASFDERLAAEAQRLKQQAKSLPAGRNREMLLRKARQTETAAHINDWLTSPGLTPPK